MAYKCGGHSNFWWMTGFFISDGETWKSRRQLVNDIVHRNRTPDFASAVELAIAESMSKWERFSKGEPFDVFQKMAGLLMEEIIARNGPSISIEPRK
jgi:cytochrome P450